MDGLAKARGDSLSGNALTKRLRTLATWAWCLGLATLALDFLSLPMLGEQVSLSYVLFGIAALGVVWAEKREFSTRVFLYRLHDAAIYSPWRFLLLYFLWISVFSPFTEHRLKSVVYAMNGWFSLFAVGLTAQFLFCERSVASAALLPERLRVAFLCYATTLALLFVNQLIQLFVPDYSVNFLMGEQVNLYLYFVIGLPYLLWDFLKDGRRLLPRWLAGLTVLLGCATAILIGRKFFMAAVFLSLGALFSLYVYKKAHMRRILGLALLASTVGVLLVGGLHVLLGSALEWRVALEAARSEVAVRMSGSFHSALEILERTNYLGQGLGLAPFRGVWNRVIAEAGVIGFLLYASFFVNLLWDLYQVRRSSRVVVSNVSVLSVGIFLLLVSHYVSNPYGAYVWIWYSIWALFASTPKKKLQRAG